MHKIKLRIIYLNDEPIIFESANIKTAEDDHTTWELCMLEPRINIHLNQSNYKFEGIDFTGKEYSGLVTYCGFKGGCLILQGNGTLKKVNR